MFDGRIRPLIDPPLNRIGQRIARAGISADAVTIGGFFVGMMAFPAVLYGNYTLALILILVSRLTDGLDGAVARATRKTDRGGFLDIVLDFIFYGAIPLAFAIAAPEGNALAAAVLLMSFFANGTTFLGFAIMAQKRALETRNQGVKSLYYMSGIAEGFETIVFLCAICLFPGAFVTLAYIYAAMCFASAAGRIGLAWIVLGDAPEDETASAEDLPSPTPAEPAETRARAQTNANADAA